MSPDGHAVPFDEPDPGKGNASLDYIYYSLIHREIDIQTGGERHRQTDTDK